MPKNILIIFFIVSLVVYPFSEAQPIGALSLMEENFVGTWKGDGKIIVSWCKQKQLIFDLQIDRDAKVSGRVGDAHIQHGKIALNKWIYRWIGNRKYIIDAELSDYLIEKENIKRKSIRIFLDFEKPFLTGGFHTSGSMFGGKEKMILSGINLKLVKK